MKKRKNIFCFFFSLFSDRTREKRQREKELTDLHAGLADMDGNDFTHVVVVVVGGLGSRLAQKGEVF
jgi:hypothetical protein